MSKKNSHKTHNGPKIKYSKHKTDLISDTKLDSDIDLTPNMDQKPIPNPEESLKDTPDFNNTKTEQNTAEMTKTSESAEESPDKELQAVVNSLKEANQQDKTDQAVDPTFISKYFSILIAVILLFVVGSASLLFFLLNQPDSPAATTDAPNSEQSKPKITEAEIEAINKLAITPNFPGLEKFTFTLNKGSALPISQIDLDKRTGFKAGTEAALASDFDELGQRLALVESVALYESNTAQKLNIKNYTQDGFQKLECTDVADECAFFYKPSVKTERPIDAYRIYFRKNDFVFYFEFAKNNKYPELDQNWLKKVANDLAAKAQ